jgi:hypothetical protein
MSPAKLSKQFPIMEFFGVSQTLFDQVDVMPRVMLPDRDFF